ncbi:MAG: hypothetical protein WCW03_03035 [Candidatus Paceibacterota bacterium]|jgi:hypothetical protein
MEPNTLTTNNEVSVGVLAGPTILLKDAWNLFKSHWKVFIMIAAVPSVISIAGQLLVNIPIPIIAGILAFILIVAAIIFSIYMQGALIDTIRKYSENPMAVISVKEQYSFGFKYFWSFLLVILIESLVVFGSFSLFVIPGIIVAIYVSFYTMTLFVDDKRGFSALTESFSLVKGRWWGVLGRFLILGLVMFAVYIVVAILSFLIASVVGDSIVTTILILLINLALGVVIGPFAIAYMYKLYESLKATRSTGVMTSSFKKWLIAFLCVGIVAPIVIIGVLSSVVLVSLNTARMKGEEARIKATLMQQQLQQEIDTGMQGSEEVPVTQ